ncbi:hypothetical protein SAMN05421788_108117 [Filimonas lacunae]|uniref:Uncharacterized protein n=1 Tax=Filimonas lacunae TaxID=477680 RepID=A0A173MDY5_9BACT|nr:hypothetical protein [Filimonas lacunae]BAV05740.1 hypothetical protein FLA_1752 [Filimonas lacunae]SIT28747.1 hypothetical protein SAMN05421788_108117 [Filimonas lacunae]
MVWNDVFVYSNSYEKTFIPPIKNNFMQNLEEQNLTSSFGIYDFQEYYMPGGSSPVEEDDELEDEDENEEDWEELEDEEIEEAEPDLPLDKEDLDENDLTDEEVEDLEWEDTEEDEDDDV